MMTETASEVPKPPAKRALFKKPAWSRPQNLASPADFFHRANAANVDPVAESELKRKAKAAKKVAEKARQTPEPQPSEKRRRISKDDDDDLYSVSDRDIKPSHSSKGNAPLEPASGNEGASASPKKVLQKGSSLKSLHRSYINESAARKVEKKTMPPPSNIIDLEDSSEDEVVHVTQVQKPPLPEEDDFPASDEEYAELARRAREKARRKRLEDEMIVETQKHPPSLERNGVSQQSFSNHAPTPPPPPLDPEVQIFIISRLENAIPLIIKRRLSQRLKDVRVHWCSHNHFTEDMANSIFLTWRGKRLFDVTTCKSLGIGVDREGRVIDKEQDEFVADDERKIHMEAMTEELYEEYQKAKRRASEQQDKDEDEELELVTQKPPEEQTKLVLKARGFPDFKLIAKPVSSKHYNLAAGH